MENREDDNTVAAAVFLFILDDGRILTDDEINADNVSSVLYSYDLNGWRLV